MVLEENSVVYESEDEDRIDLLAESEALVMLELDPTVE